MPKLGPILRRAALILALAGGLMVAGCAGTNGNSPGSVHQLGRRLLTA